MEKKWMGINWEDFNVTNSKEVMERWREYCMERDHGRER